MLKLEMPGNRYWPFCW